MLLSVRAGRSSRPVASFVRLAWPRAHRRQESLQIGRRQWRSYATESAGPEENGPGDSGSLSSEFALLLKIQLPILMFLSALERKVQ
jgi:DNA polymerase gamma 1